MNDTGNLFVIAAPSGAGKTTLVNALVEAIPHLTVSISHTTRAKRPNEVQGINYYFVDKPEFQRMIDHGDFLEYATIFDHLYGTSKSWVEKTLARGQDVILEIDWQGHRQIKQLFPDVISIFILPPSLFHLRERLEKRNQDSAEIIKKRLGDAQAAISHVREFDYVIMNDAFEEAIEELTILIQSARLLQRHQTEKYAGLLEEFATLS